MKRRTTLIALVSATLLIACTKDKAPPEPVNCDGVNIDFAGSVGPIFANRCADSGCHSAPGDDGGFSLDGIDAIRSAINTGRPVVERIDAGEMPPSGSLDLPEIDRIKCWVGAGMPD